MLEERTKENESVLVPVSGIILRLNPMHKHGALCENPGTICIRTQIPIVNVILSW